MNKQQKDFLRGVLKQEADKMLNNLEIAFDLEEEKIRKDEREKLSKIYFDTGDPWKVVEFLKDEDADDRQLY